MFGVRRKNGYNPGLAGSEFGERPVPFSDIRTLAGWEKEPTKPGFSPVFSPNSKPTEPGFSAFLSPNSEPVKPGFRLFLSPNYEPAEPGLGQILSLNSEPELRTRVWPGPFSKLRTGTPGKKQSWTKLHL